MEFIIGRANMAVTVFVPYDCDNHCPFCTSKKEYKDCAFNVDKTMELLKKVRNNPLIKDVVFTGGEPTTNIQVLRKLISVVNNKNVFINTSLPKNNYFQTLSLVNEEYCIKGINISRHATTFEEDSKLLNNIVEDWAIDGFEKPVKINVVFPKNVNFKEAIPLHLKRWQNYSNVHVSFRKDYRYVTPENLHSLNGDEIVDFLIEKYEFKNHAFCDVCDTVTFAKQTQIFSLHRGLEKSSITLGNKTIINDIVIFPNGDIAYDWDKKTSDDFSRFLLGNNKTNIKPDSKSSPAKNIPTTKNIVDKNEPFIPSCGLVTKGDCGSIRDIRVVFGTCGSGTGSC